MSRVDSPKGDAVDAGSTAAEDRAVQLGTFVAGALGLLFAASDVMLARDGLGIALRVAWATVLLVGAFLLPRCGERARVWLLRALVLVSVVAYVVTMRFTGGTAAAAFAFLPALPLCAAILLRRDAVIFGVCSVGTVSGGVWVMAGEGVAASEMVEWLLFALTGTVFGLVGLVSYTRIRARRDRAMSERISALQKLALSEGRFRQLLDAAQEGVWFIDGELRTVFANRRMAEIMGRGLEELMTRPLPECVPKPMADRIRSTMPARRRGEAEQWEMHTSLSTGRPLNMLVMANPVFDAHANFEGVLATIVDVTERVEAERRVQQSEQRMRALVENIGDAILLFDAHGKVRFANPAAEKMLGYPPNTLVTLSPFELVHPNDLVELKESWHGTLARPHGIYKGEFRYRHASGEYLSFEVTRVNHLSTEGVEGVLVTFRDVSAQRRLERHLAVSDRMASVGSLAAGVAHEINNPLAYITSNLAFAADELKKWQSAPPSPASLAEVREALEETRDGVSRVRTIVRDLKTFSRPTENPLGPVDLAAVIEHALNIASNELRHRAQVVKQIAQLPKVWSDSARLGQVLVNLLVNAAQAIREGAADRNQIRVVARDAFPDRVVLEISDTGCGIPSEIRDRIFDPFFTTKPVGIGTGLGLSICHNLIATLGGQLEFDSVVDKGTTFRVTLPVAPPEAVEAAPPAPPAPAAIPSRRVVVIDDEPMIARAVERALGKAHQVLSFTRAADALAQLRSMPEVDLILCDLMMPEMTGVDFYRELSQDLPALAQSVVFMTGGAFTASAQQFLAEVKNRRLEKPFEPGVLWNLLESGAQATNAAVSPPA